MVREPFPPGPSVRGEVVRGRFVDGRFVEDGEPVPDDAPASLSPMIEAVGLLEDQLRDAAELLQRASAASQAYLGAWAAQLGAHRRGPTRR